MTAIELSKSRRSRRRQLTNPKAAVDVAGFRVIQKPAFVLPAIRCISGIILEPILILFYFFKFAVFPYKTLTKVNIMYLLLIEKIKIKNSFFCSIL